ncbi:hypothetical protein F4813DRAFT_385992 [Daldinia decipiens]|uniref:uncharacterized protein n=1 Tax=Daldinia decipiens TaxID=326647 RepID=UPI0020C52547|nr:uncharacterized protein F4813DRAFT_385992 [Daldinia decipiens]KAI1661462.1 hypothetical protein F4813DRAFT_385992 [Daldinia decipiens]
MENQLEEKVAFFERLEAYTNDDDDDGEDDILGADEEAYRQKTKAFYSVAPTTSKNGSPTALRGVGAAPMELASDPIHSNSDPDVEIIAVTPRCNEPRTGGLSLQASISVSNKTVPETASAAARQPPRRTTRSMRSSLLTIHSSPKSDPSPSVRMGKRKKEAPLKLAPEARRIFKDLLFFYIPNDDINPARRLQIRKAREHGATWCRKLDEATHIIVDKKLTYTDIERQLQDDPRWSEKVLVNENYPIDCLKHRIIANPNQSQYKVSGTPTPAEKPADKTELSRLDNDDASLELKPSRRKSARRYRSPVLSTQSYSQSSSQRSAALISSSKRQRNKSATGNAQPAHAQNEAPPSKQAIETGVDDELTQCISEMKATGNSDLFSDSLMDNDDPAGPPLTDEVEVLSDSSSSDDRRPWKRRTRSSTGHSKGKNPWQEKFICMKGGTKDHTDSNPNAETIKVLQEMLDQHTLTGDNFRIRAYRLAIATLRMQSKKISTAEEARGLPNIGRIADKIEEIVTTNRLRQLEYALDDPRRKIIGLFLQIYGVGQIQAHKWVAQGFRTLDDLKNKADLNTNQKIGLEHFDDLNTRIPRREVEALADCVKDTAAAIDRNVELIIGGSYRRGADSSGDIDLIVTKKGTSSTSQLAPFLNQLVDTLSREGFLTVALAAHHGNGDDTDGGSKWHGCCVLPESAFPGPQSEYRPIWRRIDILLVPRTELGAALIYFTGNDIFNRSIRLLAQKKGMRLNQRGLFGNVPRGQGNTKVNEGTLLEGRDEKKIFEILGVRWREPHERWCG